MKVIISGCTGHMGQTVQKLAENDPEMEVVAGFGLKNDKIAVNYPIYENPDECDITADVVIDFSNVSYLDKVINYCTSHKTPLVLATTGLKQEDFEKVKSASNIIPIFQSYNMSIGIALLRELARKSAKLIGNSFDIEIIEKHHNRKVDSPSGTAYLLANTINEALEQPREEVFGRHSTNKKRTPNEIGIHSVRGGTIVGEHTIIFAGNSEEIELTHRAESRDLFASGAICAGKFLVNKPAGLYNMDDLISC